MRQWAIFLTGKTVFVLFEYRHQSRNPGESACMVKKNKKVSGDQHKLESVHGSDGQGFPLPDTGGTDFPGRISNLDEKQGDSEERKLPESQHSGEEMIRALLESTDDAVLIVDNSGKSIYANTKFAGMFGIPADKLGLGDEKDLRNFLISRLGDLKKVHDKIRKFNQGKSSETDFVEFDDGRVFEFRYFPWILKHQVLGSVVYLRDQSRKEKVPTVGKDAVPEKNKQPEEVTNPSAETPEYVTGQRCAEQKKKSRKAEKFLKKSRKLFHTLLSSSPAAIIKMDMNSRISDLSENTPAIFGAKKKKELKGHLFWSLVLQEERKNVQRIFKDALSKEIVQDIETTLVKKDKSTFLAEISLTLIENRNGVPKGFMAIIRDISLKKKMDVQLIHNARLVSLGEMATGIAHEINQPLNTISLTLDNFLYEIDKIELIDKSYFKSKSDKIFDNIYRIRDIIEHIRDFSRYQDDHVLVSFDLHKSITNAISMISEEFRYKEINLVTDFEKSDSHVLGNVYKFEQVMLNLLTNAKDALDEKKKNNPDEPGAYVKIHTFSKGKFIYVAVEDNGNGIPASEIDKVLLPFYSTKEEGKGTGLGLSISYGIIKEMNGTFEVQSKPGVGTTMLVRLPLENRVTDEVAEMKQHE